MTPRANADRLTLGPDAMVTAHVRAAPHGGEANEAVIRLLAKTLKVPRMSVRIVSGHASRSKRIEVDGLSRQELLARLTSASGNDRA